MPVSRFITQRRVEFCDTDMAGIVHFANFYRYMEQAEHDFFRSLGFSIMETQADGTVLGWPRVSAKCSFEAPAFYQDVLEIRLIVERIGVKSLTINYEFWREDQRDRPGADENRLLRIRRRASRCGRWNLPAPFAAKIAEAPDSKEEP